MLRRTALIFSSLTAAALASGCGGSDDHPPPVAKDIVELAQGNPELSILVEAVMAAELVGTLKGPGPFTLFAPTNSAFAALLADLGVTKAQLLSDKALLVTVLTYHVLPAKVERAQIPLGKPIATVQKGIFKIDAVGSALVINDGRNRKSTITTADIQAKNGVVHVVDKVLLPANRNIVETAQVLPQFSVLVEAVIAANLQATLSGPGPFTVFAPTNDAFTALLAELGVTKAALLANTTLLTNVLTYHVLPGLLLKADLPLNTPIVTVQRDTLSISSAFAITDQRSRTSNVVVTDVLARNGAIHAVDQVILPKP